jgi:putative transcriptional regulator
MLIEHSLQHHFLIAMPTFIDSFFYRSVIYICEHNEDGAMGLIINRPTQIMLDELFAHLEISNVSSLTKTTPVLFGGPVQKEQGMIIHDNTHLWKSTKALDDHLFLTTSTDILEAVGTPAGPKNFLITLGYSAWEAGQLEQELADNTWLTVQASKDVLFNTPTHERWQAAAKLLGIDINLMTLSMGHA